MTNSVRSKILVFISWSAFCWCLPPSVFSQTSEGWKWRFDTKNSVYRTPLAGKNNVYAYDSEQTVFAIDAQTGDEKWRYALPPEMWLDEYEEVADKLILHERFESTSQAKPAPDAVAALAAETGALIWRRDFAGSQINEMSTVGAVIYLSVENIGLAAVDAASGSIKWQSDACPDVVGLPQVSGKSIYVECFGGKVYALDAANGKLLWKFGRRGAISADFAFSADAVFYTHSVKRGVENIFALDRNTGRERWKIPASDSYEQHLLANNLLLTTALEGAPMSAVNPVSGKTIWQIDATGQLPSPESESGESYLSHLQLPTTFNRIFYFGTNDGNLLAVRSDTGKLIWKAKISDDRIHSPEIIGGRGYAIIVQNKTYYLAAINLTDGKLHWRMRLYGSAHDLVVKNDLLVFQSDDNKINAVAPIEAQRLARLGKPIGAAPSIAQVIVDRGGSGIGSGDGSGSNQIRDDVQAEVVGAGKALVTVSRKTGSNLYEIDLATGAKKLLAAHGSEQLTKPQIGAGVIYYFGSDLRNSHVLYAFDRAAGKILWQTKVEFGRVTAPPVVSDKYVSLISGYGVLAVFNLSGEEVFKKSFQLTTAFAQLSNAKQTAITLGDTVYYTDGISVYAHDLAGGKEKWKAGFQQRIGNLAAGENGVFVSSDDENLYALDLATGVIRWQTNVQGTLPYSENNVYLSGAVVYCTSEASYRKLLQARDAADGKLLWERLVENYEAQLGGDYVFADVGKVFDKRTGKSVFYDNLLQLRKLSLSDVSDANILLARNFADSKSNLKITAVDWQNGNKILWEIDFSGIDEKPTKFSAD